MVRAEDASDPAAVDAGNALPRVPSTVRRTTAGTGSTVPDAAADAADAAWPQEQSASTEDHAAEVRTDGEHAPVASSWTVD